MIDPSDDYWLTHRGPDAFDRYMAAQRVIEDVILAAAGIARPPGFVIDQSHWLRFEAALLAYSETWGRSIDGGGVTG